MGSMSDYLEQKVIDEVLNMGHRVMRRTGSPPADVPAL